MFHRISQILSGVRWASRFDNPLEILLTRHVFRRKKSVPLMHGGMQVVIDSTSSDAHVVSDVLLDGMYDEHLREAGQGRSSFRYLNLGANIGTFDLRAFQLLGSKCSGVAVEMNPATCARLIVNIETNRLFAVRAVNAAAWDERGEILVSIEGRDTGQRCEDSNAGWPVPMVPWGELFAGASADEVVDLVKIDIEGAEQRVVPCITTTDARSIRFLVIETHGLEIHAMVNQHLRSVGFTPISEEPGAGLTHLGFWRGGA